MKIEGADFVPPDEKDVPRLLNEMIIFHHTNNGNGRTGRALMSWVLIKAGYPKLFVPVKNRQQHYEAIDLHSIGKY